MADRSAGGRLALALVAALALGGCGLLGGDDQTSPAVTIGESPTSAELAGDAAAAAGATTTAGGAIGEQPQPTVLVTAAAGAGAGTSASADDGSSSSTSSGATTTPDGRPASTMASSARSTTTPASTTSNASTTASSSGSSTTTSGSGGGGGCRPTATMCVGQGQRFATLVAAVGAAGDGEVIELLPGRYNETVAVQADGVVIRSSPGGRSTIDCSGLRPAKGKACVLAVGTNLTVEDLVVTGARGPDDNEACFRNDPGTRFVVRGVECHGSNNGILGSGGSWLIEDSHFHGNGAGDGFSHNLYLSGDCGEVVFRRSTSERAVGGHAFKSRCRTSTIEGSTLRDNTAGDAAEFSEGGVVTIRNTSIHQPDGPNGNIVRHGAEGCRHPGALRFIGSTITSDRSQGYIRSACAAVGFEATELPSGVDVVDP